MVLTARGRAAYGVVCVTLLTVAVVGLESRTHRNRPPAAAEGTLGSSARPSSSPARAPTLGSGAPPESPRTLRSGPGATTPQGSGRLAVVTGKGPVHGAGPLRLYRVMVEVGLPQSPAEFAADVEATLADPRGWGADGRLSFQRVEVGAVDFTVVLASPSTTDRLCRPLDTAGVYSCFNSGRSVINDVRWRLGASAYAGDLVSYRQYVVQHEVGHALGHRHESCTEPGRLAPTMMQQTKGVGACRPNPWPYPDAA